MTILNEHLKEQSKEHVSSGLSTEIAAVIWDASTCSNYVNLTIAEIMTVMDSNEGEVFISAIAELIINNGGES